MAEKKCFLVNSNAHFSHETKFNNMPLQIQQLDINVMQTLMKEIPNFNSFLICMQKMYFVESYADFMQVTLLLNRFYTT